MTTKVIAGNKELFWAEVEKTKSIYSPESEVLVQGQKFAEKAENMQAEMFSACTQTDKFAREFFSRPPLRVLDLGAGVGVNTLPMAKSGAHVTAIEKSKELLQAYAEKSVASHCPKENLRLRRGDITAMKSYDGPFDLVVAVDILPYVSPTSLRPTMEKIQQCIEDRGLFIGTIFTVNEDPLICELMGQLGAHFYPNGKDFVTQLLQHSGFTIKDLEERPEGGFRFKAEKRSRE